MKTLLISPQKDLHTMGLKYLHYTLLDKGHESFMLYLRNFNPSDKQHCESVKKFILGINPGLVGISLMSTEYCAARDLTKNIKSFVKSAPIVWGGIHPTISPENCLDHADYVCVGEAEKTILDIAGAIDRNESIKNINNLCYLENKSIKRNPLYALDDNLDNIPFCEQVPKNSFILTDKEILKLDKQNLYPLLVHNFYI